jgi:hypothetical protein
MCDNEFPRLAIRDVEFIAAIIEQLTPTKAKPGLERVWRIIKAWLNVFK